VKAASCALLCAAAIAALGCGDGEGSEEFRKDYNAVVRTYSALPSEVGAAVNQADSKSAKQLEKEFGDLADRLGAEVRELRRLDPPEDASDEFKAFVDGLAKVRDDLREISDGAAENSSKGINRATRDLVADSAAVSSAEDKLRKAVD
jgi:hypothetical protein